MIRYRALVLLPLIMLFGCGREALPGHTTHADSAGITILTYDGPDRPLPWSARELFRLGGSETRPEESFYQVNATEIAVDQAGRLYVLNRVASMISIFDSAGVHLRSIGGAGSGPGEIEYPDGLVLLDEGVVGAIDMGRFQIVSFDAEGEPLPLRPLPTSWRGGGIVASADTLTMILRVSAPARGHLSYALVRATGTDTTILAALPEAESRPIQLASCAMRIEQATPILTPTLRWSGTADRIVASTGAGYEVLVLDRGGETRRVRRALEPTIAAVEHALEELSETPLVRELTCDPHEIVKQFGLAHVIPAIQRLAIAPDGTLWVQRKIVGEVSGPIDVFDSSGEYVGTLESRFPFPAAFIRDGRIISTETDALGVVRVVAYEIDPEGSG